MTHDPVTGAALAPLDEDDIVKPPDDIHFVAAWVACTSVCSNPAQRLSMWTIAVYAGLSLGVVMIQILAGLTLLLLTVHQVCITSEDCNPGKWCTTAPHPTRSAQTGGAAGQCVECDIAPAVCTTNGTVSAAWDSTDTLLAFVNSLSAQEAMTALAGTTLSLDDLSEMCGRCVTRGVFLVTELPSHVSLGAGDANVVSVPQFNIGGMSWKNWIVMASAVIWATGFVADEMGERAKTIWLLHRPERALKVDEDEGDGVQSAPRARAFTIKHFSRQRRLTVADHGQEHRSSVSDISDVSDSLPASGTLPAALEIIGCRSHAPPSPGPSPPSPGSSRRPPPSPGSSRPASSTPPPVSTPQPGSPPAGLGMSSEAVQMRLLAAPPPSSRTLLFGFARQVLLLLQCLRGVMMAVLVAFIPIHIAFVRSDAVSIVLDAIAAMFILDVDTKIMKLTHSEPVQRHLADDKVNELRMSRRETRLLEEGKWYAVLATLTVVVALPGLSLWLPEFSYRHILNAYYFLICAGLLVAAMILAEWRSIQADPRRRTRYRVCDHPLLRCIVGLVRWVVALGLVGFTMLNMIPG